jgi:hypothetical protein
VFNSTPVIFVSVSKGCDLKKISLLIPDTQGSLNSGRDHQIGSKIRPYHSPAETPIYQRMVTTLNLFIEKIIYQHERLPFL